MTTGQLIKAARKKAGMTQEELGKKIGVSGSSMAQWENDLRNPKLDTLQRIASALGVPVQELISDWEAVDKEEFKDVFIYGKGLTTPKDRIDAALDRLNDEGQEKAAERVEELTEIPKYQK